MSDVTAEITIEQIEALATQLEADDQSRREKLLRMIAAYCRIIRIREPGKYLARHAHYGDEDGHWDSSYPPKMVWSERTGPKSILVRKPDYEQRAVTSGFYHEWVATPDTLGLAIGSDATIYTGSMSGNGHFGSFAAHPGNHAVDITIDWDDADMSGIATAEIELIEQHLRAIAFPVAASQVDV